MNNQIKKIVIVGGGTAGWLTAGSLAAEHGVGDNPIHVTLIESPDINPLRVGEGTWPSMRTTLQKIGISESDFIRECDVSFKQGSKFVGWHNGADDAYYHPFTLPEAYSEINLVQSWQRIRENISFADAVSPQSYLCNLDLAPKQITTPEYAFYVNYGYHLDSGRFSEFLKRHCVEKLGVQHIIDNVIDVNESGDGYVESVNLQSQGVVSGDLFVDCSGFSSILLGKHYRVPFNSVQNTLFNDMALAAQVPYSEPGAAIASHTLSTAQAAGWIWDIGLASRRGVGYVFSSAHTSVDNAERDLRQYLESSIGRYKAEELPIKAIKINSGYRETLWHKNCVAIGVSAGFLEPLEATALVFVELSAKMLTMQLPANRDAMRIVAQRFNAFFRERWSGVIDFLKLHYVLTQRTDTDYWRDNCNRETIPDSLQELLKLWHSQPPWHFESAQLDEMFPSASFQYVLYGMGFNTAPRLTTSRSEMQARARATQVFEENHRKSRQLAAALPTNRELIDRIKEFGLQKI